ncbi:TraR/DksA C4-type zinc finger protein [Sulfurimonas sp. C5]|uniref:TraR/DksA family transcriptional regulator n=1 Tax=Sulfurimonas sp. C5 TaxID=3036947 RepID=UPI002453EBBC|nr:TraR/DksA C4-type zinc finger protein [Sulfurimonas sp. C5]MDH4944897.1 TraR/DksA C4-type zinc finger protein [Sulfurimonas sp. C5]
MTQAEKSDLKNTIKDSLKNLQIELEELEKRLIPIKKDCSLDHAAYQTLLQEQAVFFNRYQELQERFERLSSVMVRIDNTEYGICQECEEEIAVERLKLVPESIYCVKCLNRF